jgi:hypothetical protein
VAARESTRKWADRKRAEYAAAPVVDGVIRCSTCREEKHVSAFTPSVVALGCGVCRACKRVAKRAYEARNRDKVNAAARARRLRAPERSKQIRREWYRENRDRHRSYNLGRYGITAAEYDALLAAQAGACACCGATANRNGKRLFVDHDHETGAVRGVICHKCNAGIGALGDNVEGVRRALAYLERAQMARPTGRPLRFNLLEKGKAIHGTA